MPTSDNVSTERLLDAHSAAHRLSVSYSTIRRLAARGVLPKVTRGYRVYYPFPESARAYWRFQLGKGARNV